MNFSTLKASVFCSALLLVATGCSDSDDRSPEAPSTTTLDEALAQEIERHSLTGNPAANTPVPGIEEPLPQLGMKLFFSKALGGNTDAACVSCHHPVMGGGDGLSLPIGVDADIPDLLGPGRRHASSGFGFDSGPTVPRNAPTTFNILLWEQTIFHDGRIEALDAGIRTPDSSFGIADPNAHSLSQAQALFPVTSPEEMRALFEEEATNADLRVALTERVVSQALPNTWLEEFQRAFSSSAPASELITMANISEAIAAYENSQTFVDTPWRRYVEGDQSAITEAAKRGALLFYSSVDDGGAGCVACHEGDFFTDEQFHVLAVPQIGRGKGDGTYGDDDFGRFRETGAEEDRYAFRTPSLLNVTVTGPWGHAGAHTSLSAIIEHHLDPAQALDDYDFSLAALDPGMQGEHASENTHAALAQLQHLRDSGQSKLPSPELAVPDVADLVAFMEALTDPCVEDPACLEPWIAERSSSGPDSLQLNGVNENGDTL